LSHVFEQINIKLGRALKAGEYRVKVFQLLVNETEVNISLLLYPMLTMNHPVRPSVHFLCKRNSP